MKYLGILAVLAIVYLILARQSPVAQVQEAIVQTEVAPLTQGGPAATPSAGSTLKRPIDRTHAVLDQVKTRNGDGEF